MRMKALAAAVAASFTETAHKHLTCFMAREGLVRYVDAPVAAAPAAPAAAPAAAAPAAPGAPAAAPAAGAAAAPAAPAGNLVGDAGGEPAAPPPVSVDDAKAFLTAKGVNAEDLAKLDEAGVRAKYDELKAAEGKPGAVDPKSIELKMPDGFEMQDAELTTFREVLADANLSPQDRGQKLLDLHVAAMRSAVEEPMKLWNKMQADWQAEVMKDTEIGGQNWKASQAAIANVLDTLAGSKDTAAGKATREAFSLTGAGNNPHIVRLMVAASKLLGEGKIVSGNTPGPGAGDAVLTTMYPSAAPKLK